MITSKRQVLVQISERRIIEGFVTSTGDKTPFRFEVPSMDPPIPKDAEVTGVHYDIASGCFVFRLAHPSFPEVAEGELVPLAQTVWHLVERKKFIFV